MSQDFRASIIAHLNQKNIPKEIQDIGNNNVIKFSNITFDKNKLLNSIQSALNGYKFNVNLEAVNANSSGINNQIQRIGLSSGQRFVEAFNSAVNKINLRNGGIGNLTGMLQRVGFDSKSISNITQGLRDMNVTIDSVRASMLKNGNIKLTVNGIDEYQRAIQIIKNFDAVTGQIYNTKKTFTQDFKSQETQIQRNNTAIQKYLAEIDSLKSKYTDVNGTKPIQNKDSLTKLNDEYNKLKNNINQFGSATSITFNTIKGNVDASITKFKSLADSLRNAEYVANQLRTKPFETVKQDEINKLRQFKAEIKQSGIAFESFKSIDFNNLEKSITQSTNSGELTNYLNMLSNAKSEFKALKQEMKSVGNVTNINGEINNSKITSDIIDVQQRFSALKEVVNSLGQGERLNNLHSTLSTIDSDLIKLKELQSSLNTEGISNDKLISYYNEYKDVLSRVKNNLKSVRAETKEYASVTEVATLKGNMQDWLNKNTKAAKTYGDAIQKLINELDRLSAEGNVLKTDSNRIVNSFNQIQASAKSAGLTGSSALHKIVNAMKSLTRYFGVSTLIYRTFNGIKNGISNIIDLDTALIDLKKTTDGTTEQLEQFYYTANESAKKLGVSTKDIIQSAADWSRLGYSLNDAKTMAEVSSKFTAISPGMDIEEATSGLVSVMKAFKIDANDALDGIASKINIIGNTQAINNSDIITFLTKSSSAMQEANNTLEETIALGTAATEITRDADSVGKNSVADIKNGYIGQRIEVSETEERLYKYKTRKDVNKCKRNVLFLNVNIVEKKKSRNYMIIIKPSIIIAVKNVKMRLKIRK